MRRHHFICGIAALTFACQASTQNLFMGIQPTLSYTGKGLGIATDGPGGGFSAHLQFNLKNGHAITPRFDYLQYRLNDKTFGAKIQNLKVGVDHSYFLGGMPNKGLYVCAGLGVSDIRFLDRPPKTPAADTKPSLYYAAGLGFMFNKNIGLEMKYDEYKVKVGHGQEDTKMSAQTFNTSAVIRF